MKMLSSRRHDIQHNDTQHNDTQHKGLLCDTQHKRQSALQHYQLCLVLLCRVSRFIHYNAECRYAEGHYVECRYAECLYGECRYAECHYVEFQC